ncbi:helix-turn-helix domain-containing protein, partial [Arthrospira platensis SPKY1]|nr:helix-turn-helix domain-containing protein [Arthrospira platensis SPKY1]
EAATEGIFILPIMINIDERLLTPDLSDSEIRLLITLLSLESEHKKAFPSNKNILERTGWSLGKLQLTKRSLIKKGLLSIENRLKPSGQKTNLYTVESNLVSAQ